jgi:hypothetical protein
MATFKGEEFKFPDEKVDEAKVEKPEVEVEILPDEQIDKKVEKKAEKKDQDPTDEELLNYKPSVSDRYKKLTKGYHEERRARETAEEFAKSVLEENKRLQAQVANGSRHYIETNKSAAETRLSAAKEKLKSAFEAGDASALADAQAEVADAAAHLREAQRMQPVQVKEHEFTPAPQQPSQPQVSNRTQKWIDKNQEWFGQDEEMTMAAMGIDKKLQREYGADYVGTKEYFKTIDKTMRKRFPEYFGAETESADEPDVPAQEKPASRAKPATVVAPATRSTPPNRVRLEPRQVALARKLGITPEQYAKQVALIKRGE